MPIYEYQCSDCGHQLEALQKMSDDALIHCPECHGETLKKKISAVGFQLKGTGWYETDFKHSGSKPQSKPESKPSAKAAGSSKSDTAKPKGSSSSQAA